MIGQPSGFTSLLLTQLIAGFDVLKVHSTLRIMYLSNINSTTFVTVFHDILLFPYCGMFFDRILLLFHAILTLETFTHSLGTSHSHFTSGYCKTY